MTAFDADCVTLDLFSDGARACSLPVDVRERPDSKSVVDVCPWCGVDRAGGCGVCSDVVAVKR